MPRLLEAAIGRLANFIAVSTSAALRHPALTLVLTGALCAWLALGVARLEPLSSLLGFLPRDSPAVVRYDRFLDEFASDELILVAVSCARSERCSRVFEPRVLEQLGALEEELWNLNGVDRVLGLTSAPYLDAEGRSLLVRRLGDLATGQEAEIRDLATRVLGDPSFVGAFVSADADTAGLVVQFPSRTFSESERRVLVTELLSVLEDFERKTGLVAFAVGQPIASTLSNQNTRDDLALLIPLMFLVVAVAFYRVFRSLVAAFVPLICVAAATLLAFGLMGHLGIPITVVSSILPILIVVIGVTDAMHLMTRYFQHRDLGLANRASLERAARELGVPSLMTALTSSLGLLSFLLAPLTHLGEFGAMAAVGIAGAFVATFTLLPVLVLLFPPRIRRRPNLELGDRILDGIHAFSTRRAGLLLGLSVVTLAAAVVGMSRIHVQNDLFQILDESDYIFRSETFVSDQLRHTRTREIILEAPPGVSLSDAGAFRELANAERALLESPYVRRVDSVLALLRRVDALLGDSDPGAGALPGSSGEIEELVFLLQSAAPEWLESLVSIDLRMVRLSVPWPILDSSTNLVEGRKLERAVAEAAPGWSVSTTGISDLNALLSDLVLRTQVSSFSGAFVTILIVLALLVGSLRLALLGMIPNMLPIAVLLGLMGYWGILLDIGTAMVATVLIGISVDDTVYFLLHYRNARREGADVSRAVRFSFGFSGNAAIFSTLILAAGFSLLGFSNFQSLAYLGILSALAVILAVISELFLLPAVLVIGDRVGQWQARRARAAHPGAAPEKTRSFTSPLS